MTGQSALDPALMTLVRAIVAADAPAASRLLAASPELARARFAVGATRQGPKRTISKRSRITFTPATLRSTSRRQPTRSRSRSSSLPWAPTSARAIVAARSRFTPLSSAFRARCLESACSSGDRRQSHRGGCRSGCHRQERGDAAAPRRAHALRRSRKCTARRRRRCATQQQERLDADAARDPNTGRGGSGLPEAKAQQQEIVRLLEQHGATR